MMTHDELNQHYDAMIQFIVDDGWVEWKRHSHDRFDRVFYKKFPGEPECKTNQGKPIQMSVKVYDHRQYGFRAGVSVCLYHQPVEDQE